jgi:hypothetical protein
VKRLIAIVVVGVLAWQGYAQYSAKRADAAPSAVDVQAEPSGGFQTTGTETPASFRCDGRTHCSQMSSCAEAKYFLNNCPGVKMDGDRDGVPCEQQWCN